MKRLHQLSTVIQRSIKKRQQRIRRERTHRLLLSEKLEERHLLANQPVGDLEDLGKGVGRPENRPIDQQPEPFLRERLPAVDVADLTRDSTPAWQKTTQSIFGDRSDQKDGVLQKVGTELAFVFHQYDEHTVRNERDSRFPGPLIDFRPRNPLLKIASEKVVVDIVVYGDPSELEKPLTDLGMDVTGTHRQVVSGLVPLDKIAELADLRQVRSVRPFFSQTAAGASMTQGDAAQHSDDLRDVYGHDGFGITVGVLSDSYDTQGGAAADIASGDLPGPGNPNFSTPVNVLSDLSTPASDEGRAMLQVIHDIAPAASLAFATATQGQAAFAQSIVDLTEIAGADVIVDDVLYFSEPFFQDGIVAQAVDAAYNAGVAYFVAAGNNADNSYESDYRSGTNYAANHFSSVANAPLFAGGYSHDFDDGAGVDDLQSFTLEIDQSLTLSFQWDQPFASVTGSGGASTDMDIYVLNDSDEVVAASVDSNIGADAVEVLHFVNETGAAATFQLLIVNYEGADPQRLKYIEFTNGAAGMDNVEYATNSSTIFGHSNAYGAATVGAVYWNATPEHGQTPPLIESFSSVGGTDILFDPSGAQYPSPVDRNKPDFAAPSGGNTTFFGADLSSDADTEPNFIGTSASAAHAAGLAALLLESSGGATPLEAYDSLRSTAVDMQVASSIAGAGLLEGDAARDAIIAASNGATSSLNLATFGSQGEAVSEQGNYKIKISDEFIPVDVNETYRLSGWARSGDGNGAYYDPSNKQYLGFASYDIDQNWIERIHVHVVAEGVLAQNLGPGDDKIYLQDATGWQNTSPGYARNIGWYDYRPAADPNTPYPDYTYTRNILADGSGLWDAGAIVGNVITLKDPLPQNFPLLTTGTAIGNHSYGATYNYSTLNSQTVPDQWTEYSDTITGEDGTDPDKFRHGTAFIKPAILANYQSGINEINWRNVEFTHVSHERFQVQDSVDLHVNAVEHPPGSLTYEWTQVAGGQVTLTGDDTSTASFVAADSFADYSLGFEVEITDSGGGTSIEVVSVNVQAGDEEVESIESILSVTTFGGSATFSTTGAVQIHYSDELVPVDTSQTYRLSGTAMSGDGAGGQYEPVNRQFLGFATYDIDGNRIERIHVDVLAEGILAQDLNPNDTVIELVDASLWNNGSPGYARNFAWYGYAPLEEPKNPYPDYTYTRNIFADGSGVWDAGGISGNTITLKDPWPQEFGTLTAGTRVGNHSYGATYNYWPLNNQAVPDLWTTYSGTITGEHQTSSSSFRPGTAFIKPGINTNYQGGSNNLINWKDITITRETPTAYRPGDPVHLVVDPVEFPGGQVTYQWSQTGGPPVTLINDDQPAARVVSLPDQLVDYTLVFHVDVSDGVSTVTKSLEVDVDVDDYAQQIDAGAALAHAVTFGGSSSYSQSTAGGEVLGDNLIAVDPTQSYQLAATLRSGDDEGNSYVQDNRQFLGLRLFDSSQQQILSQYVLKYPGSTDTVLDTDLTVGQTTTFDVADATGWANGGTTIDRSIALYSSGATEYSLATDFIENAWDIGGVSSTGTITLNSTWSGPARSVGAIIRNATKGKDELYTTLDDETVVNQWQTFTGTIGGVLQDGSVDPTKFWPETAYVQPVFLPNVENGNGNLITIKDVQLRYAPSQPVDIGEEVFLHVGDISFKGPLTYQWIQKVGPKVDLQNSGTETASFIMPDVATDELVFDVIVSDGHFQITEEVVVEVNSSESLVDVRLEFVDKLGDPTNQVSAGEEFTLNAYVRDKHTPALGVFGGYLDVLFDGDIVSVAKAPEVSTDYSVAVSHDTTTPGLLNNVGGGTDSIAALGAEERLLFSSVMTATQPGYTTFWSSPADESPTGQITAFGQDDAISPFDINFGSIGLEVTDANIDHQLSGMCGSVTFNFVDDMQSPVDRLIAEGTGEELIVEVTAQFSCDPEFIVVVNNDDSGGDNFSSEAAGIALAYTESRPEHSGLLARIRIQAIQDADSVDDTIFIKVKEREELISANGILEVVEHDSLPITIVDDDGAVPECSVTIQSLESSSTTIAEGDDLALVVSASNCSTSDVTVDWSLSGNGAEYGADLQVLHQSVPQLVNSVITVSPGDSLELETYADFFQEEPSYIEFHAEADGVTADHRVHISDGGSCSLSMTASPSSLDEASAAPFAFSTVTVQAVGEACGTSVDLSFSRTGNGAEHEIDFVILGAGMNNDVVSLDGQSTTKTGQFFLRLGADNAVEELSSVTFFATMENFGTDSIQIQIHDDDGPSVGLVDLDINTTDADEGASRYYCNDRADGEFRVRPASGHTWESIGETHFVFQISGSATHIADYQFFTASGFYDVVPVPGFLHLIFTSFPTDDAVIGVRPVVDHDEGEGNENVTLALVSVPNSTASATVTIKDDLETVSFAAVDPTAHEVDESPGTFRITGGDELCAAFRLIIDADPQRVTNPATPHESSSLPEPVDYSLERVDTGLGLPIVPHDDENPQTTELYRAPEHFFSLVVQNLTQVEIDVTPSHDCEIEGDEIVHAKLETRTYNPLTNAFQWLDSLQSAEVTIEDHDDYELPPARVEIDSTSDAQCSCSCIVCGSNLISMDMQSGSYTVPIVSGTLDFISEGTHGTQPVVRAEFQKLSTNWPTSINVTVEVDDWVDDGQLALPNSPPLTFPLDTSSYSSANETVTFAVPVDLEGIDTGSYRFKVLGTNNDTGNVDWIGEASHVIINRWDENDIAPGLTFPFLKRAMSTPMFVNTGAGLAETPGVAIMRGDNTASWFQSGSDSAPDTISTLTTSGGFYILTDRYGNVDRFPVNTLVEQYEGVDRTWLAGQHYSYTDRNGNETRFLYDGDGRLNAVVDPFERETTLTYNEPQGGPLTLTVADFAARETTVKYDGGTIEVKYPSPGAAATGPTPEVSFTFDAQNRLIGMTRHSDGIDNPPSSTSADQTTTLIHSPLNFGYTRDWRNLSQILRPDGSVWTLERYRQEEELPFGGSWIADSETPLTLEDFENEARLTDGRQNPTEFVIDHKGRVTEITDAHEQVFKYERMEPDRDANGNLVRDRGEIVSIEEPDPDNFTDRPDLDSALLVDHSPTRTARTTEFRYDDDSNILTQTLPEVQIGLTESRTFSLSVPDFPNDPTDGYHLSRPRVSVNELGQRTEYDIAANGDLNGIVVFAPDAPPSRGPHGGAPWQNPVNPLDVNADGLVTSGDLLIINNELTTSGQIFLLTIQREPDDPYLDTNGDGYLTFIDALRVGDALNGGPPQQTPVAAYSPPADYSVEYVYSPDEGTAALPQGLLIREKLVTGRGAHLETEYEYFSDKQDVTTYGLLKSVTFAAQDAVLAATVHYEYDQNRNLKKFTDEIGRVTEFVFDDLNRLAKVTSPDPDGVGAEQALVTNYTYDAFGNIASVTYENYNPSIQSTTDHTTCYYYDEMDRLEWHVEAHPNTEVVDCDITGSMPTNWSQADTAWPNRPATFYTYDGNGNLTSVTDAEDRVTDFEYDLLDRPNKVIEPILVPGESLSTGHGEVLQGGNRPVTTFIYDNWGNLWSTTDSLGNTTDFTHDSWDRLLTITEPKPTGSAPNAVTSFNYFSSAFGWVTQVTDPEGRTTESQQDFLGRLTYVAEPMVDGGQPVTWFEYFDDSQLKAVIDAQANRTNYEYDDKARLVKTIQPAVLNSVTGNPEQPEVLYEYDDANQMTKVTDPLLRETVYLYDLLGRVDTVTPPDPDGIGGIEVSPSMQYKYDAVGNVVKHIDALGHEMEYVYDLLFRQSQSIDANGDVTAYEYDRVHNRTSLTDPAGNKNVWVYDKLDRVFTETNQSGKLHTYRYDAVGNLRSMTDRNNRLTTYDYDDLYRVTKEQWEIPAIRTFDYQYDLVDNLTNVQDSGTSVSYDFVYDDLDRVISETQSNVSSEPVVLTHDYDLISNRTSLSAKIGGTDDFRNTYSYDAIYRLESVTQEGQGANAVAGKQVTFGYDIAHQMTDIHRFATSPSSSELVAHSLYDYDLAGRVTSITHSREEVSAAWDGSTFHDDPETVADTIAAYFLNYDEGNRLERFSSWRDEFVVDYEYDPRNQLTSATYDNGNGVTAPFLPYAQNPTAHKETYNYDGNGNRLDANGDDYDTGLDNRLEDDDTFAYQNDDEGNRTRRTRADNTYTEYVWDHRNRLESVIERDAGGVILSQVDYVYDPFDRRIAKVVDDDGDQIVDESTAWIYDGQHIALEFTDADGDGPQPAQLSHRYLHGPMVDMILADEQVTSTATEGDVYWPLTDHLYSVRDVIDSEGNVVNHVVYDSFGNRVSEDAQIDFLFGYTGRDWDEDVDLQYNRTRWYDPSTGTWISEDPIGFAAGDANLYRMVGNKVTTYVDPDGREEKNATQGPSLSAAPPWYKQWWYNLRGRLANREPVIRDPRASTTFTIGDRTYVAASSTNMGMRTWIVGNLWHRTPIGGICDTGLRLSTSPIDESSAIISDLYNGVTNIHHLPEAWEQLPDYKKQDVGINSLLVLATGQAQALATPVRSSLLVQRNGHALVRISVRGGKPHYRHYVGGKNLGKPMTSRLAEPWLKQYATAQIRMGGLSRPLRTTSTITSRNCIETGVRGILRGKSHALLATEVSAGTGKVLWWVHVADELDGEDD